MKRGEIYWANLGSIQGREQAGRRPVILFQNDALRVPTVVIIPFTTNLARAQEESCLLIEKQQSGLSENSVALCHQIRALDRKRLLDRAGALSNGSLARLEEKVAFTLGFRKK